MCKLTSFAAVVVLLVSPAVVADPVTVGALTYNSDIDPEVIVDNRNGYDWLRWNLLSGNTFAQVQAAIAGGAYSGQGWMIARNAEALAFVDAALDGQAHACTVNGNYNDCGPPDGDFVSLVGANCTANETIAWFLSDNDTGEEAGLIDHYLNSNALLFWNERGSIAFADSVNCGGLGTTWLLYRQSFVPDDGIVGSWYFFEPPAPGAAGGPVILTLLANGQYLIGQDGDALSDPSGEDGLEWGTYSYDGTSVSFAALLDTNGDWGVDGATETVQIDGNRLTLSDSIGLFRLYSDYLVGGWLFDGARDNESIVLNFLADGTFMLVHGDNPGDTCGCGQAGIEYGTYNWNPATGALSFEVVTDTNGEFGVSDGSGWSAVVNGDQLSISDIEGTSNFTRINAVDTDTDGAADLHDNCSAVVNADQRDTNDDGLGNSCDADFDGDCMQNFIDLNVMAGNFFTAGDLDTDLDGDGQTNFVDLSILADNFFAAPGPSGIPNACDGGAQ